MLKIYTVLKKVHFKFLKFKSFDKEHFLRVKSAFQTNVYWKSPPLFNRLIANLMSFGRGRTLEERQYCFDLETNRPSENLPASELLIPSLLLLYYQNCPRIRKYLILLYPIVEIFKRKFTNKKI